MKALFLYSFLIVLCFSSVTSATPPIPDRKITESDAVEFETKRLERDARNLSQERAAIKKKLRRLEEDLKNRAADIQGVERSLTASQERVRESRMKLESEKVALQEEKERIATLISSLVKMSAIPVDTLILLPQDKSKDLMVSYHVLKALHPALDTRLEAFEANITSLRAQKARLASDVKEKEAKSVALKEKRYEISKLVKDRQVDHRKTSAAYKRAQEKAAQASRNAKNLNELIETVRKKNEELAAKDPKPIINPKPRYSRSGTKRLPVSGDITVRYGAKDHLGAKSKGVRIDSVPGAIVVSPKAGVVKYSGDFLKYGRIVLLEHGKNYHSLIAGLDKIDTVVGQKVSEGEPIANGAKTVYYELRHHGQPVNPLVHLNRL